MGVLFNGTTSKLEHLTAAGFDLTTITILAWAYALGQGESSLGRIFCCDETTLRPALTHQNAADKLRLFQSFSTTNGIWEFPAPDNQWNAVGLSYDAGSVSNDPVARVNFASATVTETQTPVGTRLAPTGTGYGIGNQSSQTQTWDGRLAHIQVFNRILSAGEMDAALRSPGSIRNGLILWVPMLDDSYIQDWSGNNNHPTGTALAFAAGPPCGPLFNSVGWQGAVGAGGFFLNLAGSITPAGSLIKLAQKILAGSVAPTGGAANQPSKFLAGSITPSGVLTSIKTVLQSLAGSIAPTGALSKVAQIVRGGAIAPIGTLQKAGQKILSGSIAPSGLVRKSVLKFLGGVIAPIGDLIKEILGVGLTQTVEITARFAVSQPITARFAVSQPITVKF